MSRIPTLDGWRGIAILLVLFDHTQYAVLGHYAWPWAQTGQHGVTIFFVLSGFLITSKLIQEPINLKRFYVRRFFRLMPVAWTYLAALLLLGHLAHLTIAAPSAVQACLFFYRNFLAVPSGSSTWHFWSLSIEEQFYMVWPCILLFAGIRRCRWIAVAGVITCAVYRWLFWTHYNQDPFNCESQVRADALLVGSLMALLLQDPIMHARAVRWSKVAAPLATAMLFYCFAHFFLLPPLIECVSIATLLAASMMHSKSVIATPLNSRILSGLGIISYSVYIWQGLFMLLAYGGGLMCIPILALALPLCAAGSYLYIESPCTRLGHRITVRRESSAVLVAIQHNKA
jgi:peptidoglycan/LPS O-acetylase OafA/YrhL